MTWDEIQARWNDVSDRIKLTWGKLSQDDLIAVDGRRDQLSAMLSLSMRSYPLPKNGSALKLLHRWSLQENIKASSTNIPAN